jgi:hypothetical protein
MKSHKRRFLLTLGVTLAIVPVVVFLSTDAQSSPAGTAGTPTAIGAYGCIVNLGGHDTVPAGSTIVIHQRIGEQALGILQNFLGAETTITSVDDAQMSDVSSRWGAPFRADGIQWSDIDVPTGVTLGQPGDQMRFTFALLLSTRVPEIFNPAAGGEPGKPTFNGPGLNFGGTCTVTAT